LSQQRNTFDCSPAEPVHPLASPHGTIPVLSTTARASQNLKAPMHRDHFCALELSQSKL